MSYRQDLKCLRRARQQAQRQQHQLATAELDGIVGVELLTIYGRLLLPVPTAAIAADLTDTLRLGLLAHQRQVEADIQRIQCDWYEQRLPPDPTSPG